MQKATSLIIALLLCSCICARAQHKMELAMMNTSNNIPINQALNSNISTPKKNIPFLYRKKHIKTITNIETRHTDAIPARIKAAIGNEQPKSVSNSETTISAALFAQRRK